MAGLLLKTEAFILAKEGADTQYRFEVFSPDSGKLFCIQRLGKQTRKPALDLWDRAEVELSPSKQGSIHFIQDFQIQSRASALATNYQAFTQAAYWANLLRKNLPYTESFKPLFLLTEQALRSWAAYPELSSHIGLKTLYTYARNEGFPVRDAWLKELPTPIRQEITTVLAQALSTSKPYEGAEAALINLQTFIESLA